LKSITLGQLLEKHEIQEAAKRQELDSVQVIEIQRNANLKTAVNDLF
jgi:hypothetical protein